MIPSIAPTNEIQGGFPTVVGPEAVSPTNLAGGIHFDATVANFDPLVVHEYLNCSGACGGPLVTSFNVTSRSDLRLYESDNNATMIRLGKQGAGFLNVCVGLLQRMIETVPHAVTLSDVVAPIEVKPVNATLDFDAKGNLIFSGYIRVSTVPHSHNQSPSLNETTLDPHTHHVDRASGTRVPHHRHIPSNTANSRASAGYISLRNHNLLPLHHAPHIPIHLHLLPPPRSFLRRTNHCLHRPLPDVQNNNVFLYYRSEFHRRNEIKLLSIRATEVEGKEWKCSANSRGESTSRAARHVRSCYQDFQWCGCE